MTPPLHPSIPQRIPRFSDFLISLSRHLAEVEAETGKLIHVGLEPEPDCVLETTPETENFFRQLFQRADGEILRRYLGVCLDTCHAALQFEDPAESLRRYRQAGIRVSKLQISAALEADARQIGREELGPFDDGVYFHQTVASSGRRWRDLPDWLGNPDPDAGVLRIHCHVPLDWRGDARLRSTRTTLTPEFWREAAALSSPHLEVETYTFDVLPDPVRGSRGVAEDMAAECKWVLDRISGLNLANS